MQNIGIIGLNGVGRDRLAGFVEIPGLAVTHLCTRNTELLNQTASQFAIPRRTTDWRELVADPELHALCICTPNDLHFPMAAAAIARGLHTLVEYPLANSLEDVASLLRMAAEGGKVLHIGLTQRYDPELTKSRELIASLGRCIHAHGSMAWPEIWKWADRPEIVGSFFALANCHFVDQLIHLYGKPAWVSASMWSDRHADTTTGLLGSMFFGYADCMSCFVSYGMGMPNQPTFLEYRLLHAGGMVEFRGRRLFLTDRERHTTELDLAQANPFQLDCEAFVAETRSQSSTYDPESAALSTRLCLLAQQSADQNSRTIPVPDVF